MNAYIIAFLIITAIICATVFFVVRLLHSDINKIKRLYKDHEAQVLALINKKSITDFKSLSENEINTILSLSEDEWEEWDKLVTKGNQIATEQSIAFDDYVTTNLPGIRNRNIYTAKLFSSVEVKRRALIRAMKLNELRSLVSETERSWEERRLLAKKAQEIITTYPDGYKQFIGRRILTNAEIINARKAIKQNQQNIDDNKRFSEWESRQETFGTTFYNLCKKHRESDGRYFYHVPFKKLEKDGSVSEGKFKVWQGFCGSFIQYQQSQVEPYLIRKLNNLTGFKNSTRHYYDRVYDEIFNIISELNDDKQVLVVFINKNIYGWEQSAYDYHYRRLKQLLYVEGIEFCNFEQISSFYNADARFDNIIVIDLISTNANQQLKLSLFRDVKQKVKYL